MAMGVHALTSYEFLKFVNLVCFKFSIGVRANFNDDDDDNDENFSVLRTTSTHPQSERRRVSRLQEHRPRPCKLAHQTLP